MSTDFQPFIEFNSWADANRVVGTDGQGTGEDALGNGAKYIPLDALENYWQDDRLSSILKSCSHDRPIYVVNDDLSRRFLRIFSILVYISTPQSTRLNYIERFMAEDIDDSLLPFKAKPAALSDAVDGTQTFEEFRGRQWLFSPVVLGPNRLQYKELLPSSVLPFTVEEILSGRHGEGTTVKKCKVHPSCGLPAGPIVLKEFESSEIDFSFKNEVDSYINLANQVPKEIYERQFLKYHGSFKQGNKAFIMLEYTDQGSLRDLFDRNELPLERHELHNLWSSLSNLFIGLEHVHSLDQLDSSRNRHAGTIQCVHQDLKPANIFVFRTAEGSSHRYEFKIGDFGMSSTALVRGRSKSTRSQDNASTRMYGAPEMTKHHPALGGIDYGVLWDIDIWSMGCVLFEVLVWTTCGSRGLSEFFEMRQRETESVPHHASQGYSGCFHNGETRIQAVDDMFGIVKRRLRLFDDLSDSIGELILREMLRPSSTSRLDAKTLLHRFGEVLESGNRHPGHLDTGARRPVPLATTVGGGSSHHGTAEVERRPTPEGSISATSLHHSGRDMPQQSNPAGHGLHSNGRPHDADPSNSSRRVASRSKVRGPAPYTVVPTSQVLRWIESKKNGWATEVLPDHDRAMGQIKDREQVCRTLVTRPLSSFTLNQDQIFVVDDSDTMRDQHWDRVVEVVHALGYLAKAADPDGVKLFFTSRPTEPKKSGGKEITSLVRSLKEHRRTSLVGTCNMENSLGPILEYVKGGLKSARRSRFLQRSRRGTSVYILTDAIWEGGTEAQCGVEEPIKSLMGTMRELGKTRATVALQFIQLGDDALGEERLRYLDDTLGMEQGLDIVDHRHHQQDGVWHMLVGSISRGLDKDNNVESRAAVT